MQSGPGSRWPMSMSVTCVWSSQALLPHFTGGDEAVCSRSYDYERPAHVPHLGPLTPKPVVLQPHRALGVVVAHSENCPWTRCMLHSIPETLESTRVLGVAPGA